MIVSMHLADLSPREAGAAFRAQSRLGRVPGLRHADVLAAARLSGGAPSPTPGRYGLLAVWADDASLDAFLRHSPLARRFAAGWHVRLEPLRATGAISGIPALVDGARPASDDEPVAVVTYARTRFRKLHRFLAANGAAADQAVAHPAFVAGTALAGPPRTVATFSLWRSSGAMQDYAYRGGGPGHQAAMKAMRVHDFHHESLFARFRPYAAAGTWDGREPLGAL